MSTTPAPKPESFSKKLFEKLLIGLLVTGILWVSGEVYSQIVRPRIADFLYRGTRIEGTWKRTLSDPPGDAWSEFKFEQWADSLTGIETLTAPSKKVSRTFKLRGEIRDGFVTVTSTPVEKRFGYLFLFLHAVGDPRSLEGYATWWDITEQRLKSEKVTLTRID